MGLHVKSNTPKFFGRREYQTMFCVCDRFSYGVIAYYSTTQTDFIISSISGSLCRLSLIMDVITRICYTHENTPINMSVISIVTLRIRKKAAWLKHQGRRPSFCSIGLLSSNEAPTLARVW